MYAEHFLAVFLSFFIILCREIEMHLQLLGTKKMGEKKSKMPHGMLNQFQ